MLADCSFAMGCFEDRQRRLAPRIEEWKCPAKAGRGRGMPHEELMDSDSGAVGTTCKQVIWSANYILLKRKTAPNRTLAILRKIQIRYSNPSLFCDKFLRKKKRGHQSLAPLVSAKLRYGYVLFAWAGAGRLRIAANLGALVNCPGLPNHLTNHERHVSRQTDVQML